MSDDLQHCPSCREEYVAGVAACVECGGALAPGPLDRSDRRRGRAAAAHAAPEPQGPEPDRLLTQLPGLEAHHTIRALLREGIRCRAQCKGEQKIYQPDQPPLEPLATTLPVDIYVDAEHLEAAQDMISAPLDEDAIGDQWDAEIVEGEDDTEDDDRVELPVVSAAVSGDAAEHGEEPVPEGTSMRTVVVLLLAAALLLFLFTRSP